VVGGDLARCMFGEAWLLVKPSPTSVVADDAAPARRYLVEGIVVVAHLLVRAVLGEALHLGLPDRTMATRRNTLLPLGHRFFGAYDGQDGFLSTMD
jgi:hypothetical protein